MHHRPLFALVALTRLIANLQNLPDGDLRAIYTYLRTVKPVSNRVGRAAGAGAVAGRR